MSISNVFTHGNLVDVNVSMWTGERQLQASDLGLEEKDISDTITLGKKKLIPSEIIYKFKHLDYKARKILERYSFTFVFGGARFIPKKAFLDYVTEMDALIKEFDKLADEFCRDYTKYKLEMRKEFVKIFKDAYARRKTLTGFDQDEDAYMNESLERIENVYPPVSRIRAKYAMDYVVFRAELPDLSKASFADIAEEHDKIALMEEAYKKNLQKRINAFVDKAVGELRQKAIDSFQHLANNLRTGAIISEASMKSIWTMIEEYEKMDIVGDHKMLQLMKEFKNKIHIYTAKKIREDSGLRRLVIDELKALIDIASDKAAIAALAQGYRERINL